MSTVNNLTYISAEAAENDPDPLDFTPRAPIHAVTRITCLICTASVIVPIAHPRLCHICMADLPGKVKHVSDRLSAVEWRWRSAMDRFDADYAHASEQDQQRYDRVQDARAELPAATFDQRYQRAKAKGDGLSALLECKEHMDNISEEYARVSQWAKSALEEIASV